MCGSRPRAQRRATASSSSCSSTGETRAHTIEVALRMPDGVQPTSFERVPGWHRQLDKAADGSIEVVRWHGELARDGNGRFAFVAATPERAGDLVWKAVQRYDDGSEAAWIGAPRLRPPRAGHASRRGGGGPRRDAPDGGGATSARARRRRPAARGRGNRVRPAPPRAPARRGLVTRRYDLQRHLLRVAVDRADDLVGPAEHQVTHVVPELRSGDLKSCGPARDLHAVRRGHRRSCQVTLLCCSTVSRLGLNQLSPTLTVAASAGPAAAKRPRAAPAAEQRPRSNRVHSAIVGRS